MIVGCTGNGSLPLGERLRVGASAGMGGGRGHVPQASDTLYTEQAAMDVYGTQPERAWAIIDSAEIVGNLTEDRASLLRAKVICLTCGEERLDTARQICEALLQDAPAYREQVLDLLVTISRKKHDNEQRLRWATEKADFCRQQGNERLRVVEHSSGMTEALRTEAEIGIILTHLGRQDEGMAKLDDVIRQLDGTRKFNEADACIIALKRKINVLQEQGCHAEIIAPAKLIVEKMDDYEQHPDEFHDGTYREPAAADVPGYCDFYRSQAYGFLANAYSSLGVRDEALRYLALFEQSPYRQTLDGRRMIAPTWGKLGDYDKMLAVYDELERRMGTDTICFDYATILHDRAIAAEARGHHAQAFDFMSRYASLSQSLNDSVQASEAHDYAARYHAQEQQMEILEHQAEASRNALIAWFVAVIALLLASFAIYFYLRHLEEMRKNRILARQITEIVKLKSLTPSASPKERGVYSSSMENVAEISNGESNDSPLLGRGAGGGAEAALFQFLSQAIVKENLFLDPAFDRQAAIDYFHLSKERIGAAFSQGSDYASISDFINECRLEYAVNLLNDHPTLPVSQVAKASGFSDANYFGRKFKARFGLSPTEFRKQ